MPLPSATETAVTREAAAAGDVGRDAVIATFLEAAGWRGAELTPLAGDASPRRYHRLRLASRRAVLMDAAPGEDADPHPFLAVTEWLRGLGLSAPEILAAAPEDGLILLEDLGDDLYARLLAREPDREIPLYEAAVDLLAMLHAAPLPLATTCWRPAPYDGTILLREARLVVDWYLPAALGRPVASETASAFDSILLSLLPLAGGMRPVAVLRDYHAENLIWLPARAGHARIGLLDYQDLLIGHPAYDLVSLLEDARRDTSDALRAAMVRRYLRATGAEPEAFGAASALLAAQRNLKILGIFTRLCRRDGKPAYLAHMPRVWAHLERDLRHPALAPLAAWCACLPAPDPAILKRIGDGA